MDDAAKPWGEDLDEVLEHVAPMRLKLHEPEAVDPVLAQWARFRDRFAEAMRDGFWTLEDLETKIADKRAFFFPGRDAAIVGEVNRYPGGENVMQLLWATGSIEELLTMLPGVESVARMMGCTGMLVEGQEAWKRVLKPHGYDFFSVTLRKTL